MKQRLIILIISLLGITQVMAESYYSLPIVREGVKWVNEKVIINHGDTTSYYYTYEFSGYDSTRVNLHGEVFHACYYYEGNHLNTETDSIISGFDGGPFGAACFRNNALNKVLREGRGMIAYPMYGDGGTIVLYIWHECIEFYLGGAYYMNMTEPLLTEENFTEVEPIEVEGTTCRRYAYVKENGDTMCYVVEGIGFDSRNMGDLLTPFTREPDPDADYQEYCGLCHVVKDGQIIYKGMRYTPDNMTGIDEVVADQRPRHYDDNYYNLMGQPVGKEIPTTPGIYIHHGKKIVVGR